MVEARRRRGSPFTPRSEPNVPPPGFPGSFPEWLTYRELTEYHRLEPGWHFEFQSSRFGGRLRRGGIVVDFVFSVPPGLAFSVLGDYYHFYLRGGTEGADRLARAQLASTGITLIFLEEEDLIRNARHYVAEGLLFRDYSSLGVG